MRKFKKYDTVVAIRSFENVPIGTLGVILISTATIESYIVEFVNDKQITLNTIEVEEADIEYCKP